MEVNITKQYMIKASIGEKYATYALVDFEVPVYICLNSIIIGSRFDLDPESKMCRIAFQGKLCQLISEEDRTKLQFCRVKQKKGAVDRVLTPNSILIKDLFKKESDITLFIGKKIMISSLKISGKIEGTFGKSGKVKATLDGASITEEAVNAEVVLEFNKQLKHI